MPHIPREFQSPARLMVDMTPDERGNVTIAATFPNGRMIALDFNAN